MLLFFRLSVVVHVKRFCMFKRSKSAPTEAPALPQKTLLPWLPDTSLPYIPVTPICIISLAHNNWFCQAESFDFTGGGSSICLAVAKTERFRRRGNIALCNGCGFLALKHVKFQFWYSSSDPKWDYEPKNERDTSPLTPVTGRVLGKGCGFGNRVKVNWACYVSLQTFSADHKLSITFTNVNKKFMY